ncbi:MAG TPA: M28 family peptidase [Acidobacteriota bacterium]|nr:M28 family peptidase [Acidobacteriota bacterium]
MRATLGVSFLAITIACTAPVVPSPDERISAAAVLDDVRELSADDMEGRGTGTAGEAQATRWIEQRFRDVGLSAAEGLFRQEVRLVGMRRDDATASLRIASRSNTLELVDTENIAFWSSAQRDTVDIDEAPLLFVGYGVQAPEYAWDDFKGVDVGGKVLLFLNNDPPVTEAGVELFGGEARTYYGRWSYKFEQAMRLGAAGALMVHTTPSASYPFSVVQYAGTSEDFALDLSGAGYQVDLLGWVDEQLSDEIARSMGTDLDGLFAMARQRDFEPVDTGYRVSAHIDTTVRQMTTENVLGFLPGSDPDLSDQIVVFTAHYDHLGTNPELDGDTVFNGAWDNALGVASIIALADAFANMDRAPRRSLLFLACAGEESGLLGSAWFVAQPPVPLGSMVANFNIDMPQIFGVTADIAAIGEDTSELGDVLRAVAAEFPVGDGQTVVVRGDSNPSAGSFYRSDQVNFAKAGIPALYLNPGSDYIEPLPFDPAAYEEAHYHQVSDEVRDEWNLAGLERDLRIVFRTARAVANGDEIPRWRPGNEFEAAWLQLHGLD